MFTIVYHTRFKYQYKNAKSQKKIVMYTPVNLGFRNSQKKKFNFLCHKNYKSDMYICNVIQNPIN